jgi:uncharacterized protein
MTAASVAIFRSFLLGALLLLAPGAARAQDYDFPQLTGRVVDEANLLDAAAKIDLDAKLEDLENRTSTQFVVVTLKSLRGRTIEEYGYRLGRHWGIGQQGTNNGVLLIVAPNERKVRIEVGYGLEGTLTDAITSVIIQGTILPRFRANDYPGGIRAGADAILEVLSGNPDKFKPKPAENSAAAGVLSLLVSFIFSVPGLVLILILIHFVFVLFVKIGVWLGLIPPPARRKRSGWSWVDSVGAGSYAGSRSGWSSSDFGGGGGGFSGGGGSFGGGGSSGSW